MRFLLVDKFKPYVQQAIASVQLSTPVKSQVPSTFTWTAATSRAPSSRQPAAEEASLQANGMAQQSSMQAQDAAESEEKAAKDEGIQMRVRKSLTDALDSGALVEAIAAAQASSQEGVSGLAASVSKLETSVAEMVSPKKEFILGQKVQVLCDGVWKNGEVTSVSPLKVMREGIHSWTKSASSLRWGVEKWRSHV